MDSVSSKVKLEEDVVKNELSVHLIKYETGSDCSEMDWCIGDENSMGNHNRLENNNVVHGIMLNDVTQYKSSPRFIYKCSFCSQALVSRQDAYCHNLNHIRVVLTPLQVYQCHYCQVKFVTKTLLECHIYSAHSEMFFTAAHGKKTHRCHICFKAFTYKNWHEHMRTVYSQYKVTCKICKVTYKSKRTYKRHPCVYQRVYKKLNYKDEKTLIHCEDCPKVFSHKTQLTLHMKNVHNIIVRNGRKVSPPQRLDCEKCGAVFKSALYLKTHLWRVHYNDGKPHFCNECGKKFKSPRCVRIHVQNMHTKKLSKRTTKTSLKETKTPRCYQENVQKCVKTEGNKVKMARNQRQQCEKCLKVIKTSSGFRRHIEKCVTTFKTEEKMIKTEIACV